MLLDVHTALGGSGTGWDLHALRHFVPSGEDGASLPMLMAKNRHRTIESVRRYFHLWGPATLSVEPEAVSGSVGRRRGRRR
ncbi:hypothetical protein [Actinomadura formosensis]|uniref:hypothetical protein n=1 Tax=Actinomadura formosensis TaxID=60706 RepID=UPI003D8F32C0